MHACLRFCQQFTYLYNIPQQTVAAVQPLGADRCLPREGAQAAASSHIHTQRDWKQLGSLTSRE